MLMGTELPSRKTEMSALLVPPMAVVCVQSWEIFQRRLLDFKESVNGSIFEEVVCKDCRTLKIKIVNVAQIPIHVCASFRLERSSW